MVDFCHQAEKKPLKKLFSRLFVFSFKPLLVSSFVNVDEGLKVISVGTAFKGEDPDFKQNTSPIIPLGVCTGGLKDK